MKEKVMKIYDSASPDAARSIFRFTRGCVTRRPENYALVSKADKDSGERSERERMAWLLNIAEGDDLILAEIYVEASAIADKAADPFKIQNPERTIWNMYPEQADDTNFIYELQQNAIKYESDIIHALLFNHDSSRPEARKRLDMYSWWKDPVGENKIFGIESDIMDLLSDESIDYELYKKIDFLIDEHKSAIIEHHTKIGISIGMNLILQGLYGKPALYSEYEGRR